MIGICASRALKQLVKLYKQCKEFEERRKEKLSEIDTQVLFVEPVLELLCWDRTDPNVVRRASRAPEDVFDIRVYVPKSDRSLLAVAIECKALCSDEFNVHSGFSVATRTRSRFP